MPRVQRHPAHKMQCNAIPQIKLDLMIKHFNHTYVGGKWWHALSLCVVPTTATEVDGDCCAWSGKSPTEDELLNSQRASHSNASSDVLHLSIIRLIIQWLFGDAAVIHSLRCSKHFSRSSISIIVNSGRIFAFLEEYILPLSLIHI